MKLDLTQLQVKLTQNELVALLWEGANLEGLSESYADWMITDINLYGPEAGAVIITLRRRSK